MRIRATALALLILLRAVIGVAADPIPADEATLSGASTLYEVKRDGSGNAYVTDWGKVEPATQGLVWKVAPAGAYTRYSGFGASITNLNDATPDSAGNIWFTDYNNPILARINTTASPATITRWDLSKWDAARTYALGGITFDGGGRLWISEQGETSNTQLLYRYDPASGRLCGYAIPDGNHSFYVVQHNGTLWLGDWVLNRIVRVVPPADETAAQITYWDATAVGEPRGLAVDPGTGYVWWADRSSDKLVRLEPAGSNANRLMRYTLPVTAVPYMVSIDGSKLWYTAEGNETSNLGNVALSHTTADTSKKNPVGPANYTPTCKTLAPEPSDLTITVTAGTLAWRHETFADVTPPTAIAWKVYEVAYGGIPYGISAGTDRVWATDQLFQQLVRITFGGLVAPQVTISIPAGTTDVQLAWGASAGAVTYRTWHSSSDPYFSPGGTPATDPDPADLVFTHPGVTTSPTNYFYVVHSVAADGIAESPDSNRTGKFTFDLVEGSNQ